jgi:prepilin-type N-terminal cleavage/methylation domain-containing protein
MKMRSARGYSLLELTIALALIGFIAIAIGGGMRFGARAWETSEAKLDALERVEGAQMLLRTLLQQALPRLLDPSVAADPLLFRGTRERLRFSAPVPRAFGGKGIAQFELSVEAARDGKRLALSWRGQTGTRERQVILTGAHDIAFAYGTADGWQGTWMDESGAPRLVRVQVAHADGAKLSWPDLVVRTRIMRDPLCIFDADTFGCRNV